jgi:outer membrane protein assembly factor BamB
MTPFRFLHSLVVLLAAACATLPRVAHASDWSQAQANAQHTGYVPGRYDPASFRFLWHVDAPDFTGAPPDRQVAIDDQNVYNTVLEGHFGSGTYHVLALDRATGTETWRHSIPGLTQPVSAPSVMDNLVYVHDFGHSGSSGGSDPANHPALVGIRTLDGSTQFRRTHAGQFLAGSRPTPSQGQVFAAGGFFGGLDAYNATTGASLWFRALNQQYGWIPAADETHVYVYMGYGASGPGPDPGRLFAVNRATGVLDYEILHPQSTFSSPDQDVVLGGMNDALTITFGMGGSILVSFDLVAHSIAWQVPGSFRGKMAVHNGQVAIPNGQTLAFLDQATGAPLWSWSAGTDVFGNVILTDNLAFVRTPGLVHAIDLATRQSVWSTPAVGHLALAHGLLVVSSNDGVTAYQVPEPPTLLLAMMVLASAAMVKARRFLARFMRRSLSVCVAALCVALPGTALVAAALTTVSRASGAGM